MSLVGEIMEEQSSCENSTVDDSRIVRETEYD